VTRISYAILGTGMMGQEHLKNLALLRQNTSIAADVVALVDPDPEMRETALTLAQSLGFDKAQAFDSLDGMDLEVVDAFVVVSPNHTHFELLKRLIATGKPILAEKPLCTSVADCDDLLALLEGYASPFWVAMEYRYMPATARFLERLDAGDIGELKMLSIREQRYPFLDKVADWNRFSENTGGTLVEKCCHHFDLMRLITGSEAIRVYASGAADINHLDEVYDGRTPDILDNAFVIVDFANGVRASLELCMFAEGAEPQEQLTAIGSKAKLDAFIPGPSRFWVGREQEKSRVVLSPRDQSAPEVDSLSLPADIEAAGDHHRWRPPRLYLPATLCICGNYRQQSCCGGYSSRWPCRRQDWSSCA